MWLQRHCRCGNHNHWELDNPCVPSSFSSELFAWSKMSPLLIAGPFLPPCLLDLPLVPETGSKLVPWRFCIRLNLPALSAVRGAGQKMMPHMKTLCTNKY